MNTNDGLETLRVNEDKNEIFNKNSLDFPPKRSLGNLKVNQNLITSMNSGDKLKGRKSNKNPTITKI